MELSRAASPITFRQTDLDARAVFAGALEFFVELAAHLPKLVVSTATHKCSPCSSRQCTNTLNLRAISSWAQAPMKEYSASPNLLNLSLPGY
jgi:hypothetical protein